MSKKVLLDPGHGGKDPGAVSANGVQEKDLNLQIALKIFDFLKDDFGVWLTRDRDKELSLRERVWLEHMLRPDVFLSIHCNSSQNPSANGFEVWVWKNSKNGIILAENIQRCIAETGLIKTRGIMVSDDDPETWQRRLTVLADTRAPACLVECGFISNNHDLEVLLQKQDQIAQAIALGVRTYASVEKNALQGNQLRP